MKTMNERRRLWFFGVRWKGAKMATWLYVEEIVDIKYLMLGTDSTMEEFKETTVLMRNVASLVRHSEEA